MSETASETDPLAAAKAALAERCPRPWSAWRHARTGDVYRVIAACVIEAGVVPAVAYSRDDGVDTTIWVRPLAEFLDRFNPEPEDRP